MTGASSTTDESAPRTDDAARGLRRIIGNGVALLGAYLLPRLFTAAAIIVAARALGAATFGAYGTAAAFAVILSIVSTLGMQPLLVREMARNPDRAPDWLRSAHLAKSVSGAVMLGMLLFVGGFLLDYSREVMGAATLLGLGYAIGSYAENLSAYFQAVERMHVWMQASALYGFVTGVLGSVLVLLTHSVAWFCAATVAGQVAAVAWLSLRMPRRARTGRAEPIAMAKLLREMWPFAGAFIALAAFSKADVLLLERWRTAAEVGSYAAAYKFIDIAQALGIVAAAAVYPRLSRDGRSAAASRLMELAVLAAMPAAGVLFLAREPIVLLMFGSGYTGSIPIVAALAAAIVPLGIAIVGGYVLAAAGAMTLVAALYGVLLVVKLSLNALLVPTHGALGAGIAMLGSELLLAAGMTILLARHSTSANRRVWASVALCTVACALAAWVPGMSAGVRAVLFLAAVTAVYATSGPFGVEDRAVLIEAVRGGWRVGGVGR